MKKASTILLSLLLQLFVLTACASKNENDAPATGKAPSAAMPPCLYFLCDRLHKAGFTAASHPGNDFYHFRIMVKSPYLFQIVFSGIVTHICLSIQTLSSGIALFR